MPETYVPTRFFSLSTLDDGTLVLFNSRTGAIGTVPPSDAPASRAALRRSARHEAPLQGILRDLQEGGFLIPDGTDEQALVHRQYVDKYDDRYLNLIILPTEECNFRCVYCYESFLRGTMPEGIREGIRRYVAGQNRLKRLDISWFGGEPLLAVDVVIELSRFFSAHCRQLGIAYSASMTTNGSLLTPDVAEALIAHGVRYFQITLDGVRHEHDKRRIAQSGGDTFDVILRNLRHLKSTPHPFVVALRHNFDPEGIDHLSEFIAMLKTEFGGDVRFTTLFQPIGKWGGPNDSDLSVCEGRAAAQRYLDARVLAVEAGFRGAFQLDSFRPNGFVCYAANPRSFVIGSDGRLYKCTVELDYHDRNIVGRLRPDGTMELDWRKMALWCETNGLDEGKKCGSCFFQPACHGAICPKQWMDANDCDCPPERIGIRQMLPLIVQESRLPAPPPVVSSAQCTRG